MGFYLNPGLRPRLDDGEAEVAQHLHDFTLYGAEMRGAQRERRTDDPHVPCDPPSQDFMTLDDVQWVLQQAGAVDDRADFYGTEKYCRILELVTQLQNR